MSTRHADLSRWAHDHRYGNGNAAAERGTRLVLWITLATMVVEIVAGWLAQSTGLIADSLDMLADAFVYGLSLWAVGRASAAKLRAWPASSCPGMPQRSCWCARWRRRWLQDARAWSRWRPSRRCSRPSCCAA